MKFKSDIEVQAGLKDSSGSAGTSGQVLLSTATGVSWSSQGGYVPYTGATGNVDLGNYSLSAYDLIINHTSGSGVAASITKGGNGEALTVVKTSGSGNAASITGGVTLISELNLTTALADAYIASAATWNAKQNALSGTGFVKISGTTISYDNSTYVPTSTTITINGVTQDLSANRSWTVTGGIGGSGTATYLPKFTAATTVADSQLIDNGTYLSIGNPTNTRIKWGGNTTPTLGLPFSGAANALWLEVNDGDTGGIAIDNEGVTVYGAGDTGYVFRAIDEDVYQSTLSVTSATTFQVNQGTNGGGYMRGIFNVTDYLIADNSARAPIFYDSNDTSYYADFNSTSQESVRQRGGTLHGPNATWGAYLLVGGNGRTGYINNALTASVVATDGNLHLDAGSAKNMYFNWYDGDAIIFGNGSESQIGYMSSAGDFTANSSSRSPIFYDSDNTGYYLNPASLSNLNQVTTNGTLNVAGSNAQFWTATGGGYQRVDARNDGTAGRLHWYGVLNNGTTSNFRHSWYDGSDYFGITAESSFINFTRAGGGSITTDGSFRAPIFYDSNNTGYYVDPTGTSAIDTLVTRGPSITSAGHSSSYKQVELPAGNNGAATGIVTMRTWCSEPNVSWDAAGFGYNVYNDGGLPSGFGRANTSFGQAYMRMLTDGNWWFYNTNTSGTRISTMNLTPGGNVIVATDVRAPLFYDSNDTAYYLDPASTSKISKLYIRNGGAAGVGWSTGLVMGDDSNYWNFIQDAGVARQRNFGTGGYDWFNSSAGTQLMLLNNAGTLSVSSDVRSPTFYDSNNTGYYVDPSNISVLNSAQFGDNSNNDQGIGIYYGSGVSSYGRIRFYQSSSNSSTIHSFSTSWQNGSLATASSGAINISGNTGTTFGAWNNPDLWIDTSGNAQARGSSRAPIFYDSNNTGYYVDPASNSNFNSGAFNGQLTSYAASSAAGLNCTMAAGLNGGTGAVFNGSTGTAYGSTSMTVYGSSYGAGIRFVTAAPGYTNSNAAYFYSNTTLVGSISCSTTNTTYATSSDYRLKENIIPMESSIVRLMELKPCRFNFVIEKDKVVDGFIAHEVQEVVPEAATGEKDETDPEGNPIYQGIDQSKLVPLLTSALQEAITKIKELENRLSILENK